MRARGPISTLRTETFYAFERAARVRFEPSVPTDLDMPACIALATTVLAARGSVDAVAFSRNHWDGKDARASCTKLEIDGRPLFVIGLPPERRRPWAILHEVAHVLTWDETDGGHGPAFARTCVDLWSAHGDWPATDLVALAAAHGVEIGGDA